MFELNKELNQYERNLKKEKRKVEMELSLEN
jgi:hypothetical protein